LPPSQLYELSYNAIKRWRKSILYIFTIYF
jgi:hypothetical protein